MKNPPHTYLQKLRSYLDPAVTRKVSALAKHAILFHCCSFSFPLSDPLSLVQDIPTAEERLHTLPLEQTAWELKLTVNSLTLVRKETVVYLERPGLRNLCPAESLPIPCGAVADSVL